VLTVDGQPQHDIVSGLRQIVKNFDVRENTINLDALMPGTIIRATRSANLFVVHGASLVRQIHSAKSRVNLEMCYCSLLERCWTVSLKSSLPQASQKCPDHDPKGLLLPEPEALSSPQ
jgi:hypothetical protein